MSDYLKNIRGGNKQHPGTRRPYYDSHQYKGSDRRVGMERRGYHKKTPNADIIQFYRKEILPALQSFLDKKAEDSERLTRAVERRAEIEERKTSLMEVIVKDLNRLLNPDHTEPDKEVDLPSSAKAPKEKMPLKPGSEENREKVMEIIKDMRAKGETITKIAEYLEDQSVPTFSGRGKWRAQTVSKLIKML